MTEPKTTGDEMPEYTYDYPGLHSDDAIAIAREVRRGISPSDSKVKGADREVALRFREDVRRELVEWLASNPDGELAMGFEAGDDPEPYPNGKPGEMDAKVKEAVLSEALAEFAEKGAGDHFYGAWKGGSKGSGGGPAGSDKDKDGKYEGKKEGRGDGKAAFKDDGQQDGKKDYKSAPYTVEKVSTPDEAIAVLEKGGRPDISDKDVPALMDRLATRSDHLDLTEVHVNGTPNFGLDGLGIARKDMPQIPSERVNDYMADLKARGIKVDQGSIDPRQLQPVQKEVSGTAAAKIVQSIRAEGGLRPGTSIVISNDGFVIDGHHRWAAATAYAFEVPGGIQLPYTKIGLSAKEALKDAESWSVAQGISHKALGESFALIESAWEAYEMREVALAERKEWGLSEAELAEKDDGHYFGAWKGGKASSGGGPAGSDKDGDGRYEGKKEGEKKTIGQEIAAAHEGLQMHLSTEQERAKALGGRDVMATSASMDGTVGRKIEATTYVQNKDMNGKDQGVTRRTLTGTVTRIDRDPATGFNTAIVDLPGGAVVHVNAGSTSEFKVIGVGAAKHAKPLTPEQIGVEQYKNAVARKADAWVPGGGGKETPFTKNGTRYQYVFNPGTGKHGVLDMSRDMVIDDKEFYRESNADELERLLEATMTDIEETALAEKDDGHPYGAWKGGSKGSGGGMAGSPAVKEPKGEPGSAERAKDVDGQLSASGKIRSNEFGQSHVEVRTTDGNVVSGRLESITPGEITVRQYSDAHKAYASVPVKTANISHVNASDKGWSQTNEKGVGWTRVGSKEYNDSLTRREGKIASQMGGVNATLPTPGGERSARAVRRPSAPKMPSVSVLDSIKGVSTQKAKGGPGFDRKVGAKLNSRGWVVNREGEITPGRALVTEAGVFLLTEADPDQTDLPLGVLSDLADLAEADDLTTEESASVAIAAEAVGAYIVGNTKIEEVGRRNSAKDAATLQKIVDLVKSLGIPITAEVEDPGEDTAEEGMTEAEPTDEPADDVDVQEAEGDAPASGVVQPCKSCGMGKPACDAQEEPCCDNCDHPSATKGKGKGKGFSPMRADSDSDYAEADVSTEDVPSANIVFREGSVEAELVTLAEAAARFDDETRTVYITPIKPGWGNKRDNRYYPTKTLEEATAAGRFNNLKMFSDHPRKSDEKELPERSVKDWVATTREAEWDVTRQRPIVPLVVHDPAIYQRFKEAPEQIAFSVLGSGVAKPGEVGGKKGVIVESIARLRSVDWVTEAGAGGALDFAEAAASEEFEMDVANMTTEQVSALKESNPALYKHLIGLAKAMPDVDKEEKEATKAEAKAKPADYSDVKGDSAAPTPTVAAKEAAADVPEWAQPLMSLAESLNRQTEGVRISEAKAAASKTVEDIVGPSTLPRDVKRAIKAQFAESQGGPDFEETVTGVLHLAESLFAKAAERPMVRGLGATSEPDTETGVREASIREATDRIGTRFGTPVTPRKDQLIFTPDQMGGIAAPTGSGEVPTEFAVSEASQDVQDKIAAKF